MRLIIILTILCILCAPASAENKVFLKDGEIMVQTPEGINTLDYDNDRPYQKVSSQRWDVKEEANPVNEAMKVYQKKEDPLYHRKVWIWHKGVRDQSILLEFTSLYEYGGVAFSPLEDFVYYLGLSHQGIPNFYGVNLLNNQKFVIGNATDYRLINCINEVNYLIVKQGGEGVEYILYDLAGKKQKTFTGGGSWEEIKQSACQ